MGSIHDFMKYKNVSNSSVELYFYGDIVSDTEATEEYKDQSPESVKQILDKAKGKNLNIYINSGGGSVFAGMAIYNMIKRHNGFKTVYVDGLAASIASIIALAGDKVIIPSNAYFMIHKPWTLGYGNAEELRKIGESLDVIEVGIMNVYQSALVPGVNIETIREMVQKETWLTGDQAAQYFKVEVSDAIEAVAITDQHFENKPYRLKIVSGKEREKQLALARAKLELIKMKRST